MKPISEAQLADYIAAYLKRSPKIKRLVDRHFQGTITSVTPITANTDGPFLVNVDRTDSSDNNDYVCAVPMYYPQVGDLVELEWRDENFAYVKYPIQVTHQKAPTVSIIAPMTSVVVQPGSTDWSGYITFVNTNAQAAGTAIMTVLFSRAFSRTPFVIVHGVRGRGEVFQTYYPGSTTGQFQVVCANALLAGTDYSLVWWVASPR